MGQFRMKIAGQVGQITTCFDSTIEYCRPYLTENPADFSAVITPEDRAFEQEASIAEALEEGIRPRKYGEPHLERAALQRKFAEHLFRQDILMLHGSAVALDGAGYLFTADSGTGKSTHTRLWRQLLGDRAVMVNDDKPFLHITPEGVTAYGSPWSGKHGLDNNLSAPLAGICILERGKENAISPMQPKDALPLLRHQAFRPEDPVKEAAFLALTEKLANAVPLWHLFCRPDPEAAKLSFDTMSR